MGRLPVMAPIQEQTDTILLSGGLDLVTPKISLKPGRAVGGENFEVAWNQGYTRIAGYERFDGRSPKPHAAVPEYVGIDHYTLTPTIGMTLTGSVSGRSGVVAGFGPGFLNFYNLSGVAWTHPEELRDGSSVAYAVTSTTTPSLSSVESAQQVAASADQARAMIQAVPGSGPLRGVFHLVVGGQDQYFAVRDDASGTSKRIYKATTAGWVLTTQYYTIAFSNGGTDVPTDGQTLTQGGVTATIKRVVRESGSWAGSTAAGRFIIVFPSGGNFAGGAATIGAVAVTLIGAESPVSLVPGGTFVWAKNNFSGLDLDKRIYGADGVGVGIEFDGDVLVPIPTGTTPDTPSVVIEHLGYLMWGIRGSLIYSGPGLPYAYTAGDGAGEIAVGDAITNLSSHPASQTASALGIYCEDSTHFLFGNSPADWHRNSYKTGVGAYRFTAQTLNHAYVFHSSGVIDYRAAESFGNFVQSGLTYDIQSLIQQVQASVACSTVDRQKSQYRVFFTDGSGLYVTIVNGRLRGTLPVRFAHPPVVMHEAIGANKEPVRLFGDANGMVYEMEKGTSFDGDPITAPLILSWYYGKHPRFLKTWTRVFLELEATGLVEFRLGYNLQYGDHADAPRPLDQQVQLLGSGVPKWDEFTWDDFTWDGAPPVPSLKGLRGKSVNIQFVLTCTSTYLQPFTLSALIVNYLNRRLAR